MFCTNCGQKLTDGARFCTACGQRTQAASTVPAQPSYSAFPPQQPTYQQSYQQSYQQTAQAVSEHVLMVLQTNRKYSMMKMTPCNIVFMPDRIILAYLTRERQKAESDRLSQEIKASGKGFFKGSAAMMSYWADYHKRYYQMSTQQIMAEDPENQLVYNNSVSQLLFHAYDTDYSGDGGQTTTGGKLNISLAGGETLKFSHSIGNNRSIRDTLTQLFGSRLKYKR
jgi:hypothetical protein